MKTIALNRKDVKIITEYEFNEEGIVISGTDIIICKGKRFPVWGTQYAYDSYIEYQTPKGVFAEDSGAWFYTGREIL